MACTWYYTGTVKQVHPLARARGVDMMDINVHAIDIDDNNMLIGIHILPHTAPSRRPPCRLRPLFLLPLRTQSM